MKVYAKQVPPEFQESPLFIPECFPENIAVCGNRDFISHKPEVFERVQSVLEQRELAEVLEHPKEWANWYKNATEAPETPENISGYSFYCIGWNNEQIKNEIADVTGAKPEEIKLFEFGGYTKTAYYKEV